MHSRKYATKTRGRPFEPGNPGKPKGARHRATLAVEALLDGEAKKLTRKAIDLALAGDTTALRLCLDRILPPCKGRPIVIALPDVTTAADLTAALATVIAAMGAGALSPDEAATVCSVIEVQRRVIETAELEARLRAIEEKLGTDEEGA